MNQPPFDVHAEDREFREVLAAATRDAARSLRMAGSAWMKTKVARPRSIGRRSAFRPKETRP